MIEKTQQKILEAIQNIASNNANNRHTNYEIKQTSAHDYNNQYLLEYPDVEMINTIANSNSEQQKNSNPSRQVQYIPKTLVLDNNSINSKDNSLTTNDTEQVYSKIYNDDTILVTDTDNDPKTNQSSSNQWFLRRMIKSIRYAIADITNFQAFNNFLAHYRIEDIRRVTFKNSIDWKWTKEWFNHNLVDDLPTSRKLIKFRAWQIKNCSNSLPTIDILQKYNPELFSNVSLCWHCKAVNKTNQHLWLCPTILKKIKPRFKQLTLRFIALVQSSADTLQVDISNTFRTNPIFSWSFQSSDRFLPSSTDHAFYLTCRGFCTNVFTSIFTKFFSAKIRRQKISCLKDGKSKEISRRSCSDQEQPNSPQENANVIQTKLPDQTTCATAFTIQHPKVQL
ncbi:hypothetical protein RclHR1_00430032 [Rhizophagus clarus]|uniref:Uncharacterized protein n=1 Tax=Rhizophagus clarus TaxID=94130 RepID=A0A2Z6RTV2_9GLOM|nr:hypothetical protein RclHR1_00430032 [Rhizophagus clarus]